MIDKLFQDIGLSDDHAAIYAALLAGGPMQASQLQKKVSHLKRPTLYKYLSELVSDGYVGERTQGVAKVFEPVAPAVFVEKANQAVRDAEARRKTAKDMIETLHMRYVLATEKPSLQYYDGIEGIKEIYSDHLASGKDMYFVRTGRAAAYNDFFGEWWGDYLDQRAKKQIKSHGITPDDPDAFHDSEIDKKLNIVRSWVNPEDYTASVEVNIYGEKTAIISYGKELFGLLIDHKEISTALRDLFRLAEKGAATLDVRHDHE